MKVKTLIWSYLWDSTVPVRLQPPHSLPGSWSGSAGSSSEGPMFYHSSTFKTDASCHSNEGKLTLGMCSVAQRCCVSDWYLCSAHSWNKTASAPEWNRNHWFPLAIRRIEAETRLSLMLGLSLDLTESKTSWLLSSPASPPSFTQGRSIFLLPRLPEGSQKKLSQVTEEGKITKINTAPTHLLSVFPHIVGTGERNFLLSYLESSFLFKSVKLDIYCQLWNVSVEQRNFFAVDL